MHCPLCRAPHTHSFQVSEPPITVFWHCANCDFLFKDPAQRLDAAAEKARYDTHQNGDEGHRNFLTPAVEMLRQCEPVGAKGLDWGSGPVPVLAEMLEHSGYSMKIYDPFYHPDKPNTGEVFDFVTMTEVIEHLYDPWTELRNIHGHLKTGGHLVLMTELHKGVDSLPRWYYRKDPTHVGFLGEKSLRQLRDLFGLEWIKTEGRCFLFRKV